MHITERVEAQLEYLRSLAITMDNRQVAESIKAVVGYKKDPADGNALPFPDLAHICINIKVR